LSVRVGKLTDYPVQRNNSVYTDWETAGEMAERRGKRGVS